MLGTINNIDLSVYNHLRDRFIASGIGSGGISGTFTNSYPSDTEMKLMKHVSEIDHIDDIDLANEIIMPVIALEEGETLFRAIQLGSTEKNIVQPFVLSIFAESKRQLNNLLSQAIFNIADNSIQYKDYESDFDNPITVGTLKVDFETIRLFRIKSTDPEMQERHRAEVFFDVETK